MANSVSRDAGSSVATKAVELPALTGVRGMAASWVAFAHIYDPASSDVGTYWSILPVLSAPGMAVTLFFILSGFIMMHVYGNEHFLHTRRWFAHFMAARFARIYPAYIVSIGLFLLPPLLGRLIGHPFIGSNLEPSILVPNVLMIQDWGLHVRSILLPGWFISVEWFAYWAAFPWVIVLFLRSEKTWHFLLWITIAAAVLWGIQTSEALKWQRMNVLLQVIPKFALGAACYGLYQSWGECLKRSGISLWSDLFFGAVIISLYVNYFVMPIHDVVFTMLCAGWLIGLAIGNSPGARFLSKPAMIWLGGISYSLYTVHDVVIHFFWHVYSTRRACAQGPWVFLSMGLFMFALSVLAAWMMYRLVEHPCRNYLRRRLDRAIG